MFNTVFNTTGLSAAPVQAADTSDLARTSSKAIKTQYYYSLALQQLSIIWLMSFICIAVMLLPIPWLLTIPANVPNIALLVSLVALGLVTLGSFQRTRWGRLIGIILSLLLVSAFPIGSVFGLIGLTIYIRADKLFGATAISHSQLKQEYRLRVNLRT